MSRPRHLILVALLSVLGLLTTPGVIAAELGPMVSTSATSGNGLLRTETLIDSPSRGRFHPSRVIVRFRKGAASFLPGSGKQTPLSVARETHLVVNPPGLDVRAAIARYRLNPNVIYAEPDFTVEALGVTPNDILYAQQWDLAKIAAPAAWDMKTDSADTVVAVIDTGIDYTHEDLIANLYSDGANPAVRGYTCMNGSCVAGGSDDHGHGTHVAGTIGAATHNGLGMAGINWSARMLSMKFLGANGSGQISDAILAFQQLLALRQAGVNIRVINNSWGGGGYSQALKDAMAAVETAGILNVCAAGNSGVNADMSPMYPAAYDNRGILSVLATDANDAAASFTNYGISSVDIAAPGVNTLSTVPKGSCSLCDASGYKGLSGTSMAAPHVAGSAVAVFSADPGLTPAQARDAFLDPASYDAPTNANARLTSSGGRLNHFRVLTNAPNFVGRANLNQFPTVTVGPDAFVAPGTPGIAFTQQALDPDGDTLRSLVGRGPVSAWTAWLFGWRANQLFPTTVPFPAPTVERVAAMPYDTAVSDNRGGGASGRNWAVVTPTAPTGQAPTLTLTVPETGLVGTPVTIGVTASDPNGGSIAWDINASGQGGSSGVCCYTGSSVSMTFNSEGTYRITSQAIDPQLNTSATAGGLISIGATPSGKPPTAAITLDKLSGAVPLSVNVSAVGSSDSDGTLATYFFDCGVGFASGIKIPNSTCTFTNPGTYWVRVLVLDDTNKMGVASAYVVATPPPPASDTVAPRVSFVSPVAGATLMTPTTLQVSASDNVGVTAVDYYLGSQTESSRLATVSSGGLFDWTFDPALYPAGSHQLIAIARDAAGNQSAAASLSITTAQLVKPAIALSPSGIVSLSRNKTRTFTASLTNTPSHGLQRVTFEVHNGTTAVTPVTTDSASPFTYNYTYSKISGTYTLTATPYDSQGNAGLPVKVTVRVR